jgi:cyanosortase A-associated protein
MLNLNNLQKRTNFLATTAIGISLVTVYTLIEPTAGNRSVASFDFPSDIPLNNWQQLDSKPLNITVQSNNPERLESGRSYQYNKKNTQMAEGTSSADERQRQILEIEARYIIGSRGYVENYISKYTDIAPKAFKAEQIKYSKEIGYYFLFKDNHRAYLSSCISPRSQSTVTQKQFASNRYQADLKPNVLFNWLLGKASIRDSRCLWMQLSMPLNTSEAQITYATLQEAWSDWYRWWLTHFPSL